MSGKMGDRGNILARLRNSAAIKRNQSALFQWYLRNFDAFAAIVAPLSRPGWDAITEELTTEGLTKADGSPLTAAYARQTWWKVRRLKARGAPSFSKRPDDPPSPAPAVPSDPTDDEVVLTAIDGTVIKPKPPTT